jgi:hypothetical protein
MNLVGSGCGQEIVGKQTLYAFFGILMNSVGRKKVKFGFFQGFLVIYEIVKFCLISQFWFRFS